MLIIVTDILGIIGLRFYEAFLRLHCVLSESTVPRKQNDL